MQDPVPPEFSRPYRLTEMEADGDAVELVARPEELAALAARFGVPAIRRLTASLELRRDSRARNFLVRGRFSAALAQTCVVTLEPVETEVDEEFTARFVRDAAAAAATDVFVDVADGEPPEPIAGETVDLGELVAQYLSLSIDPYPRKPGVRFEYGEAGAGGASQTGQTETGTRSPFARLELLRGGRRS